MVLSGYVIAVLAVCCYALIGPIAKKFGMDMAPFTFVMISSIFVAIMAAIPSFLFERQKLFATYRDIPWPGILTLALINVFGYALYMVAIKKIPIVHYDMVGLLMPIVGGLMAVWLLGEPFHARYLVGLAIIAVGIFVAVKPFS